MSAESLAERMALWARTLAAEPDQGALRSSVATMTVAEVPGAYAAGVSLLGGSRFSARATEGRVRIEAAQYAVREGPCLDALAARASIRSDDLTVDARWPRLAPHAVKAGVRSALALGLFVTGQPLGVLSVYAPSAGAFGQLAEAVAGVLAAHASVAIASANAQLELRTALRSRDLIGQAKGVLMQRYGMTSEEAFDWLVTTSQTSNTKLRDVARELITSRDPTSWRFGPPTGPPTVRPSGRESRRGW
ncbi:ANTAR domain-containing protein [Micromonospora sp. NPDC050397]|uniref:ANTAR domain-containing protein n=1 Tax=Micromonospora sp. NPDC050397 TaxID=3364279 RepID=UPI00384AA0F5